MTICCTEHELNIRKWKAHILRSVNQESAKQNVLEVLDDTLELLVIDWAMKFVRINLEKNSLSDSAKEE